MEQTQSTMPLHQTFFRSDIMEELEKRFGSARFFCEECDKAYNQWKGSDKDAVCITCGTLLVNVEYKKIEFLLAESKKYAQYIQEFMDAPIYIWKYDDEIAKDSLLPIRVSVADRMTVLNEIENLKARHFYQQAIDNAIQLALVYRENYGTFKTYHDEYVKAVDGILSKVREQTEYRMHSPQMEKERKDLIDQLEQRKKDIDTLVNNLEAEKRKAEESSATYNQIRNNMEMVRKRLISSLNNIKFTDIIDRQILVILSFFGEAELVDFQSILDNRDIAINNRLDILMKETIVRRGENGKYRLNAEVFDSL